MVQHFNSIILERRGDWLRYETAEPAALTQAVAIDMIVLVTEAFEKGTKVKKLGTSVLVLKNGLNLLIKGGIGAVLTVLAGEKCDEDSEVGE